jgi:glycosyltransferase involved in cell wall biosynthesis
MGITPDNTIFVVLSFEGPDVYSLAGGLGVRISHLVNALSEMGFDVHHIFVGDPGMEGVEVRQDGKLTLHRWCQWISEYHPGGVYDGEEGKLNDFARSTPPFVTYELAAPAISQGKLVAILGEEWHTAETMCRISDLLHYAGLRDKAVLFWNANNTYGFERLYWQRLAFTTTITTVSKYMKQIMQNLGVNSLVIPNGIPRDLLEGVNQGHVSCVRDSLDADVVLSKVARFSRDKGWSQAVHAIDGLKKWGRRPVLLARGGVESYGKKIGRQAKSLGLELRAVNVAGDPKECYNKAMFEENFTPYLQAMCRGGSADILNLLFPIPQSFLRVIYGASDVVLANSAHEPFGLVGLEAMATGAVVFTGCSGEDYATHMHNAIVLDTSSAEEIQFYVDYVRTHPEVKKRISLAAKRTAEQWTWEDVVKRLICKLEYQARVQGFDLPTETALSEA